MISSVEIKQKLFRIAEIIHLRVFGHEMGEEMRKFLGHLSWSFFGGMIAASIMFVVNILAGRWLGPEEYGKYNLIFLMAQLFLIPMILGMDVAVSRSVAKSNGDNTKIQRLVSSAIYLVIFSIFVSSVMLYVWKDSVAGVFFASSNMVLFAILFSIAVVLKTLFDGIIKGIHLFRFQAIVRIIEAIIGTIVFLGSYFILRNHLSLVLSIAVPAIFVFSIYAFRLRKFFGVYDFESIKTLFRYARFVIIGALISLILGYGDRFVINRYLGIQDLGLYSAYYTATILIFGQFLSIVTNVFFPMIAQVGEKRGIMKKLDKLSILGILPSIAVISIIGYTILKLFGSAYVIQPIVLVLFGTVATLQFFISFYANIVNAHSETTYFRGLAFFAVRACVYAFYILILILMQEVTIPAILIGLVVNYVVDIFNLRYIIKKYS